MSEPAAERLEHLAGAAEPHGRLGEKLSAELREDAEFARSVGPARPREAAGPVLLFGGAVAAAFLLERVRGEASTPGRRARRAVARVGDEIAERAWTVGRDARAEARKRRAWTILQGAVGAGFTLLARRAAAAAWTALTAERRPPQR